ncbi:uncharacterized protein PV06_02099 [Exophiala oligosperma]|uniref:Uncharacterized protein n=1 Tax=Exophiala oligosperma TaxID=215243 RepID=A0A0D2C9D6_9EURO|nr:uncharacterized protein PV06_02099 [Exophiala oligosperma]KIW46427.1 hypothetical protein PV06_02099 [Exophiala oligosperma]
MDDFERRFGNRMGRLGTAKAYWRMDTRSAGLSISKMLTVSVVGTQKKVTRDDVEAEHLG